MKNNIKSWLFGRKDTRNLERLKAAYAEKGTKTWLKFDMHCQRCGKDLVKRLQQLEEVLEVEPDFENSQVIAKGAFESGTEILKNHAHKKLRKRLIMVNREEVGKEDESRSLPKVDPSPRLPAIAAAHLHYDNYHESPYGLGDVIWNSNS